MIEVLCIVTSYFWEYTKQNITRTRIAQIRLSAAKTDGAETFAVIVVFIAINSVVNVIVTIF